MPARAVPKTCCLSALGQRPAQPRFTVRDIPLDLTGAGDIGCASRRFTLHPLSSKQLEGLGKTVASGATENAGCRVGSQPPHCPRQASFCEFDARDL